MDRPHIAKVRLKDTADPHQIGQYGEGIHRVFGLILALANVHGGLLLIDEIERGLHYSIMPDVWKLIFALAHRLNVQVFATSHSWDCIGAFQLANDADGVLIRLERFNGESKSIIFSKAELEIATREHIEVR